MKNITQIHKHAEDKGFPREFQVIIELNNKTGLKEGDIVFLKGKDNQIKRANCLFILNIVVTELFWTLKEVIEKGLKPIIVLNGRD